MIFPLLGNSHFNITDFLQPFLKTSQMIRYSLKSDIVNKTRIRDKTSYLPQCSYSENCNKKVGLDSQCGLFQPVVTDNGICFSFNPNSTLNLLKDSPFKNDFQEIYRYDMSKTNNVERARGAGDRFALKFMVDNSRYLRNKKKKRPFKILISSNEGYFNFVSSAKEVKAGYETIFDVQPIEIMASENLCEVEERHRKCRLPKEVDKDSIFRSYSQISCEFECKIQVNLCQKHLFLDQLTQNMTKVCSLIYQFST